MCNIYNETDKSASRLIIHGNTYRKQVALTFDSGFEDSETAAILEVLKRYNVKCTFFLTGIWVEKFQELTKRIIKEGHEIGNHSYEHPDMCKITYQEMVNTILNGEEAIKKVSGINPKPLFRQPFGSFNKEVLKATKEAGYEYSIYWSIDTIDWKLPDTQVIVNRTLYKVKNGDIILLHVAGNNTAVATDSIIENLKARGLSLAKVSELLKDEGAF